ncbi:hypothetical protein [Solimonas flava]|uniref:hypothetical protein n=1 Tax=Solimonas flava TaxID=415849 RepID=UPI0012B5EFE6|nr:hypothetical protein [Solimonas flava]
MKAEAIKAEAASVIRQFGANPLGFFWVLHDSENENLDFEKQNERWAFVKSESWHSLNMAAYSLWAISDNGDLLWWNGEQTVAMRPRDYEFISRAVAPSQFIRLLVSGVEHSFFPKDLYSGCAQ